MLILRTLALFIATSVGAGANDYLSPVGCGSPFGRPGQYGPYDYANLQHVKERLPIVEKYHFNHDVETLKKGMTGTIGSDIDYTLRAFPNHYRGLRAISEYQRRTGLPPANASYQSAECYFVRAIEFKPDDAKVYLLYGDHLHKSGYPEQALGKYAEAKKLQPSLPDLEHAIGLAYFDVKDYMHAKQAAENYYARGGVKSELRDKLKAVGEWKGGGK